MDFKWISDHYDWHLRGTCTFKSKICAFEVQYPACDDETGELGEVFAQVYELNVIEKIQWHYRQWLFEKCVGYHWTYTQNKKGSSFYYRKPEWLYKQLFNWYYRKNKWKNKN